MNIIMKPIAKGSQAQKLLFKNGTLVNVVKQKLCWKRSNF